MFVYGLMLLQKPQQQFSGVRELPDDREENFTQNNFSRNNKGDVRSVSDVDDTGGLDEHGKPPHLFFYTPQPSTTFVDVDEVSHVLP